MTVHLEDLDDGDASARHIIRMTKSSFLPIPRFAETDDTCFVMHRDDRTMCTNTSAYILDPEATSYLFVLCAEHMAELRAHFTNQGWSYRARNRRTIEP